MELELDHSRYNVVDNLVRDNNVGEETCQKEKVELMRNVDVSR